MLLTIAAVGTGIIFFLIAVGHIMNRTALGKMVADETGCDQKTGEAVTVLSGGLFALGAVLLGMANLALGAVILAGTVALITVSMHKPWGDNWGEFETDFGEFLLRLAIIFPLLGLAAAIGF